MATNSPPPSSPPTAVPPVSGTNPPPPSNISPPPSQPSTSPPSDPSTTTPPSLPNANPPDPTTTPSTPSPSLTVPSAPRPQPAVTPPPSQNATPTPVPSTPSPPPPQQSISPTASPPPSPSNVDPPPPPPASDPPNSPPPAPVSNPPTSSPPPTPPPRSPPPTSSSPPASQPPSPPTTSPPPQPPANPPNNSTPSPPRTSPPPSPPSVPPQSPPPASTPPRSSPPAPAAVPPINGSPPPKQTPRPPASEQAPPPSNSSSESLPTPPPPIIQLPPPPSSQISGPPTDNTNVNRSIPSSPESSHPSNNNGIGTAGVVAIACAAGIVVLSLIGLAIWFFRKRRKEVSGFNGVYVMPSPLGSSPTSDFSSATKTHSSAPLIGSGPGSDYMYSPKDSGGLGNSRSLFTYEELVKATNGFSAQNLLGEGGFGCVYKGYLPDGREVAIKQLKVGGGQGEREFKAEVEIISRVHHRHLVSLVGYCISESQRLLIYEYVPNDTLYFHLHGEGRPVLEWGARVKIAAGAARGIAYLHEGCHPRIIHRDIKSSNILLDSNFEARVSDFGLAKLALDANTHVTTRVMGTFGYMAPEYASSGKLTEKSDVFSFGVVLLELITGRKPVDASQPVGDESLVEWARPLLSHALENQEFESLVDPSLGKNYVDSEMFRMIEAAAACVRHSAAKRPQMGQVVRAFDGFATSDLTNGMRVGESEVFNSAQQSEEIRWFQRMAFGSQNYSTDFFSRGSRSSDN